MSAFDIPTFPRKMDTKDVRKYFFDFGVPAPGSAISELDTGETLASPTITIDAVAIAAGVSVKSGSVVLIPDLNGIANRGIRFILIVDEAKQADSAFNGAGLTVTVTASADVLPDEHIERSGLIIIKQR